MRILHKTILLGLVLLFIINCSKDDALVPTPTSQEPQNVAPQIENQEFTISESITEGTSIGTIIAKDTDEDVLTYSIIINDNELFDLSPEGALSLATTKEINYDIAQAHTITVSVSDGTTTTSATITINVTNVANVYLVGSLNGKGIVLKDGEDITPSILENESNTIVDLSVQGNDIYVISTETLYKNNTAINIINNISNVSFLSDMHIIGEDVYICGNEKISGTSIARVWRNGNPINLSNGNNEAYALSVFVEGTDVYVAGFADSSSSMNNTAVVWKNGTITELTDGSSSSMANAVYVRNGDVYVAGYDTTGGGGAQVALWKNNTKINLSNGNHSIANDIYVTEDNDIYTCGYETIGQVLHPKVWRNNEETNLASSIGGEILAATKVSVFEDDVYVLGRAINPQTNMKESTIWKNGEATYMGNLKIRSLFIK
ncbi:cadherin repeat domain-containing protein [Aquimarina algiphila]|uniref:cadherin repeat domain-containing protein n=1 Tax=Aquimarina algiphila TaxID=2047982 RepID=UPI00232A7A53|nr:cadherin repeat domain-containing protein [Aquimarina algiphila]